MDRILYLYIYEDYVGQLIEKNGKNMHFIYDDAAKDPISISMPISIEKYYHRVVYPFFENLLPEGDLRKQISQMYHVSANNPFSLLSVIGEDCAGAIRLSNKKIQADDESITRCPKEEFLEILKRNREGVGSYMEGMRLSLAGAQNKTSRIFKDGIYYYSNNAHPSTHIIKFDNSNYPELLVNEWFCTTLAGKMKLPVSKMVVKSLEGYSYLSIERFDRMTKDDITTRIHQEDFCQILGVASSNKYQTEGGPSLLQVASILKEYSSNVSMDLVLLAKIVVFNVLIGNADYHGKNLSIQHLGNKKYRLTPFYDLVSTVIYENLSLNSAMNINRQYDITKITSNDLIEELNSWDMNGKHMLKLIMNDFKNIVIEAENLRNSIEFHKHQEVISKIIEKLSIQYNKIYVELNR